MPIFPQAGTPITHSNGATTMKRLLTAFSTVLLSSPTENATGAKGRPEASSRPRNVARASPVLMLLFALAVALGAFPLEARAQSSIERGKYLVTVAGCSDCHTPGTFLGHPDRGRYLGGSDVGFAIPGLGVFAGPNLTPDKETGIGNWSIQQIVTAITTGKRPDGRGLAPVMPFEAFSHLSSTDAEAIAAYLKSLKPVSNKVAGPFGPSDKPSTFVFAVMPAEIYSSLPKPPAK